MAFQRGVKWLKEKPGFSLPKESGTYVSEMQAEFIAAYCDSSRKDTYMNARKAMTAAGYKNIKDSDVGRLMGSPTIRMAMNLWLEKNNRATEITRQQVIRMLLDQYEKSDTAEDRSNAIRAAELLGKSVAMFSDRLTITTEQQKRIDDTLRKEAYALSQKRMEEVIDTECRVLDSGGDATISPPLAVEQSEDCPEIGA